MTPLKLAAFNNRQDRTAFLAEQYGQLLQGRVLDVGCDNAVLRGLLPNLDYTGVDIGGNPTIRLDLEKDSLPFGEGTFDVVMCCDVLEHLDSLHRVFREIVTVTRPGGAIILSLPNNWANARRPIERGQGSFGYYGLPAERPNDRHKWFFSLAEALAFYQAQTRLYPLTLTETCANAKPRNPIANALRQLRYPGIRYLNRYAHTVWGVFRKG